MIHESQTKVPRTSPPVLLDLCFHRERSSSSRTEVEDEMWEKDVLEFIEGVKNFNKVIKSLKMKVSAHFDSGGVEEVDRLAGFEETSRFF